MQIRSIALHGYWGTEDGFGSLDTMKEELLAAGFTPEEVAILTDGVALTATQMAIWSCSNKMSSIEFINSYYSTWGVGDVPAEKEDEVKLLFKVYDYLMALEPTELEGTTADTIINPDNFVGDMSITVIEKAEDHANNEDEDDTNDAYVTNLTFALVVQPSTENGDDLVVTVIGPDGVPMATGRIAGEAAEGETVLVPDENGNYCFENLTLVEGEQNISLSLSGIQNLREGVYLYTSEIRSDDGEEVSSQTLVGVSSGERSVNVSMDITFEVDVDDTITVTERVWHDGGDPVITHEPPPPPGNDPPPPPPDEFNPPPEEELPDEEVPLADVPFTGDESSAWLFIIIPAAMGLVMLKLSDKKREEEKI